MLYRLDIMGNIVTDAEVKTSQSGNEFVAFRVAVNEYMGDEKKTTFFDVSYAKNNVLPYLKAGQRVYISGKPSLGASLGKDGKAYHNAHIYARDLELLGSSQSKEN